VSAHSAHPIAALAPNCVRSYIYAVTCVWLTLCGSPLRAHLRLSSPSNAEQAGWQDHKAWTECSERTRVQATARGGRLCSHNMRSLCRSDGYALQAPARAVAPQERGEGRYCKSLHPIVAAHNVNTSVVGDVGPYSTCKQRLSVRVAHTHR
jgi:hypothetical protein